MLPGTMPHRPGMSASLSPSGTTIMSHVLVPMIFTSVPGAMPDPTPPRCASNAPTATGSPSGNPVRTAHSNVSPPTARSIQPSAPPPPGNPGRRPPQSRPQRAQLRIKLRQELGIRVTAPGVVEHPLVSGGAYTDGQL